MKTKLILALTSMVVILFTTPLWAADTSATSAPKEGEAGGKSLTELNKELTNPISSIWSLSFQQNNFMLDMGPGESRWNSNLIFQPVLPVALTSNWNLITRPVMTLFSSVPYLDPHNPGDIDRTTAFGDIVLMELLSPSSKLVGNNWLLGLGPTFIFPTASSDYTGQGKYQVGPAALVGYLSKKWILGALVQNWQSFEGKGDREDTNQMNLQPIAAYFLPGAWAIGYSGNILANWKADGGNVWTVPLGLSLSKVLKLGPLPVKIALGGQYMPIHPDIGGQKWNIQLSITPVLPKLIKGTLFGE